MTRYTGIHGTDAVEKDIRLLLEFDDPADAPLTPHRFLCLLVVEKGGDGKEHDVRLVALREMLENIGSVTVIGVEGVPGSVELNDLEIRKSLGYEIYGDLADGGPPGDRKNLIVGENPVEKICSKTPYPLEPDVLAHQLGDWDDMYILQSKPVPDRAGQWGYRLMHVDDPDLHKAVLSGIIEQATYLGSGKIHLTSDYLGGEALVVVHRRDLNRFLIQTIFGVHPSGQSKPTDTPWQPFHRRDILTRMHANERYRLDPELVSFAISEDETMEDSDRYRPGRIIGQPRAVEALKLALAINAKGYNVFAAGYPGTGKRTAIMRILKEQPFNPELLRDIAYVDNFRKHDQPRVLYFSPGDAGRLRRRLRELATELQDQIPSLLEQGAFRESRDGIMLAVESSENQVLAALEERLNEEGFTVAQIEENGEQRSDIQPLIDGSATDFETLHSAVTAGEFEEKTYAALRERYYQLMDEMNSIFLSLRTERAAAEHKLRTLQHETAEPLVHRLVEQVSRDFVGEQIQEHLADLETDVLDKLELFLPDDRDKEQVSQDLLRYDVNVILDHGNTQRNPVNFESHPDYHKIFGTQEFNPEMEGRHGFLSLRGGSLIGASGGYLVLRAEDVLGQEDVWNGLKRALQDGVTEIRTPPMPYGPPVQSLKPEPIRVDLKVVLMGSEHVYDFLFYQDEEFGKLFKILSEFDSVMDYNAETRRGYLDFMRMICEEEKLLKPTVDGKSAVLEYGIRLSEFRSKLSTRFSLIADLLRESSHWARVAGKETIDRAAVEKAREVRKYLHNLPEEKYDEQISSGEMILQVDGKRIGAINGLSVLDRGYYAFGRPMLITARVAPGTDGIINIERESGLSGELHDKGVYIIQGFLQATYAIDFPLSINASIGFEQSYVEIDGDSASSTEIYVLLSAIGDLPLRQDIAVTGSVNQFGQIQPVGGISEKIEGFYATCKLIGLTGRQGVAIPRTNIQNLILSQEVQEAVKAGKFHIYAISTVDEGMEILTERSAGSRKPDGHFEPGTINAIVERRLREMAEQVKNFS